MSQFAIDRNTTEFDKLFKQVSKKFSVMKSINAFGYKIDAMAQMAFMIHHWDCKDLFRKAELAENIDSTYPFRIVGSNKELNKEVDEILCFKYAKQGENFLLMSDIIKGRKLDKKVYVSGTIKTADREFVTNIAKRIKSDSDVKFTLKVVENTFYEFTAHFKFKSESEFVLWKLKNKIVTDLKVANKEKTKKFVEENF